MMKRLLAGAALATVLASTAQAAITVDGVLDAGYGAATAHVFHDPGAPTSNFGAATNANHAVDYDIYLTSDANYVYGLLVTGVDGTSAGTFANLYFDIDRANGNGSDIGFEITNNRAFLAGIGGYSLPLSGLLDFATTSNSIEFRLSNSVFTGPLAGLVYPMSYPAFPSVGDSVTLRLSQSFGYSVAGGPSYGVNRLGTVTLGGAVPEPATWAMMIAGFGLAGATLRRRRMVAV
jgi:opacity protein-like surface antigen